MKEDNKIEWKSGVIDVSQLDDKTHSIEINCTQDAFTLTFEGLDRGKTEFSIRNVSKLDACPIQTTISDSTTSITSSVSSTATTPTTTKESTASTSHQESSYEATTSVVTFNSG